MKNKKLFAILTLVAFMLTMMPVMAFGASVQSAYGDVEKASVLAPNGEAKFSLTIPNYDATADSVRVFFTVANTNEIVAPTTVTVSVDGAAATAFTPDSVLAAGRTFDFVVKNATPGQFDVKAYIVKGTGHASITAAQILNGYVGASNDIIVNAIAWDTDNTIAFRNAGSADAVFGGFVVEVNDTPVVEVMKDADGVTTVDPAEAVMYDYSATSILANNGLDYYEVTGTLTKGGVAVKNTEITAEFNKVGAFVSKDVIETNARGIFKFNVYASKAGTYVLNLSADGAEDMALKVKFGSAAVGSVTPAEVTGHVATTSAVNVDLTAVDTNGNALAAAEVANLFKTTDTSTNLARFFQVVKAPEDSAFVDAVYKQDSDVQAAPFTFGYNTTTGNYALKFTPDVAGEYTIKMYAPVTGGDVKYINISAKKFDKTVQAVLTYSATSYNAGAAVSAPTVTLIDANGTKKFTNGTDPKVKLAYSGVGITGFGTDGSFTVSSDDKYLGKEIVVNAIVDDCFATATLKIADAPAYLQFTNVTAPVGTEATVPVVSMDLAGNVAALGDATDLIEAGAISYVVTNKPANAIVSVDVNALENQNAADNKFIKEGKGIIKVASNKAGTVTVNVIVKTQDGIYLTGIATVNFGEEATPVQQSATLIIGSNVFVANGGVQTAPVAPAIIDGRTYLPIRAVGQAIGAQVDYADGIITLTLGAQKATMAPGSNVMTVGTQTVTMDAAPYLAGDNTMVPVRYAAQAFGYELGTTSNADGSVATVTIFK